MKILIIDDAMVMRNIHKNVLKDHGLSDGDFLEAGDGGTALEIAEKENIDLFLVDWNIPRLNGLEFIKKVRSIERYAKTPIIMITSEAAKYNVLEAIEAGTTSYVVKPIKADVLWQKISKYVQ
jgi:two-component system chemotaxis response regulator CheY